MLAPARPAFLDRIWFPLGEQTKADDARPRPSARGSPLRGRAESQEACFLAGDDYRAFLERHGLEPATARSSTRRGARARAARRLLALHARPAPRARRLRRGSRSTRSRPTRRRTRSSSGRASRSPRRASRPAGGCYVDVERVEAKLRYRSPAVAARRVAATAAASGSSSTSRPTGSRAGRPPSCTKATPSSAPALITSRRRRLRSRRRCSPFLAFSWNDLADLALAVFPARRRALASPTRFVRLGGTFGRLSSFIKGTQGELLPVINKVGGTVDRVNAQLDKVDLVTDSAVDAADSVDTAVRAVSFAIQRPVQKVAGLAAGVAHGCARCGRAATGGSAVQRAKEAAARREAELAEELRRADSERP